jgi:SPP1 family predicted phage head-tail adaptor
MAAGNMDQRITLRRLTRTPDGAGGVTEAWADFETSPTVWAAVTFKAAKEDTQEGSLNASQLANFEIYNRDDVSELDALIWRGETYNIRVIRRYGSRQLKMWLDAERGVNQ